MLALGVTIAQQVVFVYCSKRQWFILRK